eukprot:1991878-Amphidinium_carterae.1
MAPKKTLRRPAGRLSASPCSSKLASGFVPWSIWDQMDSWQEGVAGQSTALLLAAGHLVEIVMLSDGGRTTGH